MYQKLIHKFVIGLFLTIPLHVFGITFQELSPSQKQIHTLLFQIARNETKNDKNHFAVALEIVTRKNATTPGKTYVFLLKSMSRDISFISGGTDDVREDRKSVHDKLYGTPCKGPKGRGCKNAENPEECGCCEGEKESCYCYRKGFFDSEFACIAFLENEENKKYIADFINEKIQNGKVTKISLHGFTTRDTCSACFQHLIAYCENANSAFYGDDRFKVECKGIISKNRENIQESKETFWKKLKNTLGKKVENLSGPVDFYISSRIYFSGSRLLVEPMVNKEKSEKNPMKMLVLWKEFDKKYPEGSYLPKEWPSKFSTFMETCEDLAQGFCSYLNEPKRRCLNKIISAVKSETPGVIDISDQINK